MHTETVKQDNAEVLKSSMLTDCRLVVLKRSCQKPTTESTVRSALTVHQVQPRLPFSFTLL